MDVNYAKVIKTPLLGNGLVAELNLKPGDVILRIANPYLIIVEKAALDRVCSQCLVEKENLKRCSRCKVIKYCSTRCQIESWQSIHQGECAILKKLPDVPPTPVRALIQVLLRHKYSQQPDPRWAGLEPHVVDLQKGNRWDEIVLQAKAAIEFSNSPADWMEVAIGVLCRMTTNAFRVTLVDNTLVGLCFEPIASLANHSCSPNANVMFDGRRMMLRALDPIKKDEQVFISYIDSTQLRDARRAELQERYLFLCNCEKCVQNDTPYGLYNRSRPTSSAQLNLLINQNMLDSFANRQTKSSSAEVQRELEALPKALPDIQALVDRSKAISNQTQRLQLLKQALGYLYHLRKHEQYAQPPYPSILQELYLCYLDNSRFLAALIVLIFMHLKCDVYNYPQPHHPIRVIRLFAISKLLKHVASLDDTALTQNFDAKTRELAAEIDYISAVQTVLILVADLVPKSHGKGTAFMSLVEEELRDVEEVQKLRGVVGEELTRWSVQGGGSAGGFQFASTVFEGLRKLGRCAFYIIDQETA